MSAVTDNTAAARYELIEDGRATYADYRLLGDRLVIDHVFTPPALRGQGTAGRLMAGLVEDVRTRGLKITPVCSYAVAWLKRHPETADLL